MSGNLAFDFTGRTVLVTGAAQGIGRELARFFAAADANVYVIDRDADLASMVAEELGARAAPVDVTATDQVNGFVERVVAETGRIDVLVNNAGYLRDGVVWRLSDDDWDQVMAVSAGGTFRFTRACVPHFRAREYGRIINVTSYTGLHGNVGQANYAAAKAGVVGLTKTTAKELGRFGVTVNAIVPNAETRMVASIPEAKRAELTSVIPLGRFGQPVEMCTAVGFLASEEAGYVTGTILAVDGGLSM